MSRLKHALPIQMFLFVASLTVGINTEALADEGIEGVDLIVVKKAERVLHLMRDWQIVRSFPIALGGSPVGHKRKEGDSKTPEGFYEIDGRKEDSDFYRALLISYPDAIDSYLAWNRGDSPGGSIVIHGLPNNPKDRRNLKKDWTEGCIALNNRDMKILWESIPEGTPILIEP